MLVDTGEADCLISGLSRNYLETIRPAIEIIGMEPGLKNCRYVPPVYQTGPLFLADTPVNFHPTAEELADITLMVAKEVRQFNIKPRIAMPPTPISGAVIHQEAKLVRQARELVKEKTAA